MADELEELFSEESAPAPEVVEPPVEQPAEEAPVTEQPEQVESPQPEPVVVPEKPEAGFVPIAAMMDERDKRKALEAELTKFRSQQQAPEVPNPIDDPDGYAAYQNDAVDQRLWNHTVLMSAQFTEKQYGKETVESAMQWADTRLKTDPMFVAQARQQINPVEWIVQQHKRDEIVGQIGDRSLDDFILDHIAKNPEKFGSAPVAATTGLPVAAQPKPAVPPVRVPRSLATQGASPSDIRDVATGPLAAVDSVFTQ